MRLNTAVQCKFSVKFGLGDIVWCSVMARKARKGQCMLVHHAPSWCVMLKRSSLTEQKQTQRQQAAAGYCTANSPANDGGFDIATVLLYGLHLVAQFLLCIIHGQARFFNPVG
jgi:hypothetical protein